MDVREKLVELLYKADRECNNKQCETCKHQSKKFFCKIHFYIDHLIANGVTVQKWIPVSERLPEKGGSYLVFSSKSKTVFTAHYWLGDRWSNRANGQFITHWMPLPEPPKGE